MSKSKLKDNALKESSIVPMEEKLEKRRLKNIVSAQVSRKRAKLQKNTLENRLCHLKYEKMKLLLENEALQKQNIKLEKENVNLKYKFHHNYFNEEESFMESAVKHAWFVSIPLLKEWAFSKTFFILIIVLQSFKINSLLQKAVIPCANLHTNFSQWTKYIVSLTYIPWKIVHHASYPQYLMIFNG